MNYQACWVQLPLVVRDNANIRVTTPGQVARVCQDLRGLAQECFQALTLNTNNRLINRHLVTLGLVDTSLVHSREVFRCAILDNAAAVILVHNHPSGDPNPSASDIRTTKGLVDSGRILDIEVLDHIIIGASDTTNGGEGFVSLRESGQVDFT